MGHLGPVYVVLLYYIHYCSQLRLHAQHWGRESVFTLHDGFEASAVAASERYVNISNHGVKYFFAMSLVFPIFGFLLSLSYIKGARLQIRKCMNDPENFPTIAALFWVGQTFTIFVIVLDCLTIGEEKTTHTAMERLAYYQYVILIVNLTIECFFWLFAIVVVLILSITHCITGNFKLTDFKKKCIKNLFHIVCCPIFCIRKIGHKEARLWLFLMGFIPPLWSAFSHLGYIIGGWISYEERSIAVVILYSFSFVFLYSSLQYAYQYIFDIREYIHHKKKQIMDQQIMDREDRTKTLTLSYDREMGKHIKLHNDTGFNYVVLIFMVIPWLLLNGIIVIVGCIVVHLPVIESVDDILTHIYILGQYTFIFAVFLLTYNLVYLTGERGTSGGGLVNNKVLKFWKYLHKDTPPNNDTPENIRKELPNIYSNKDRADSLMAALVYQLTKLDENDDRYKYLLQKIMEEKHAVDSHSGNGTGTGGTNGGAGGGWCGCCGGGGAAAS